MGFNKRMISKDLIVSTDEQSIPKLFDADSLIFDNWSYTFFELYLKGKSKKEIMEVITNVN